MLGFGSFRMPLHADNPAVLFALSRLDDAVWRHSNRPQPRRDGLSQDTLMVSGVDLDFVSFKQLVEAAAGL